MVKNQWINEQRIEIVIIFLKMNKFTFFFIKKWLISVHQLLNKQLNHIINFCHNKIDRSLIIINIKNSICTKIKIIH